MAEVVEHVVLFKAREGIVQGATDAWAEAVRELASLEGVLHLYVGAVLSCKPDAGAWSFALYGRYRDKAALDGYAVHPKHLQVVALGSTLFSDVMALDWEAPSLSTTPIPPSSLPPPGAFRFAFSQWKQHCSHDNISSVTSYFRDLPNSSSGANFAPGRARGFEWGFVAFYGSAEERQEDGTLVQTLSTSSAVEKFLLVDVAAMEGTDVHM